MKAIGELLGDQRIYTLPSSATVLDAARLMKEARVGALLITGERDRLVGIFTERDLMARVVVPGHDAAATLLEEVMTRNLVTAPPDRCVTEVAQEMQQRHIRHLPVVENGELVGVLSLRDLLRSILAEKEVEVDHLTAYIQRDEG